MSAPNASASETLEHAVARLLRTVPQTWTEYDESALSALEERGLFLLTGAGMIERRISFRLQMFGHPVAVEATITVTGEYGFAEAVKYIPARMQEYWREVFEKRKGSDQEDAPAFRCERIGNEQWRLTAEGLLARGDLDNGNSSMVFDFVLKRGFFDGRPRLMPDGRISRREPVRGQGKLEKMTLVNSNAGPTGVSIDNWGEGAKAFAAAFAELFKSHTSTQQAEGEKPKPPDDPYADLRDFARSRLKGQERAVIEALCDAGGELPIADLAVVDGVGWDDPFQGFKDAQRRLNPKLKPEGWRLERRNNAGFLVTL
jgi:hypothetical protein